MNEGKVSLRYLNKTEYHPTIASEDGFFEVKTVIILQMYDRETSTWKDVPIVGEEE